MLLYLGYASHPHHNAAFGNGASLCHVLRAGRCDGPVADLLQAAGCAPLCGDAVRTSWFRAYDRSEAAALPLSGVYSSMASRRVSSGWACTELPATALLSPRSSPGCHRLCGERCAHSSQAWPTFSSLLATELCRVVRAKPRLGLQDQNELLCIPPVRSVLGCDLLTCNLLLPEMQEIVMLRFIRHLAEVTLLSVLIVPVTVHAGDAGQRVGDWPRS